MGVLILDSIARSKPTAFQAVSFQQVCFCLSARTGIGTGVERTPSMDPNRGTKAASDGQRLVHNGVHHGRGPFRRLSVAINSTGFSR
jgi:hypothetical protein